jgi:transposase
MNSGAGNQPDLSGFPEAVRVLVQTLLAEVAMLKAKLEAATKATSLLTAQNQLLRQKLDALARLHFGGTKNEGIDPKQMDFFMAGLDDLTQAPAPVPPEPPKAPRTTTARKPARSGIPANLPVQEVVIIPEEVKANPEAFRQIDEVVTKELDFEPARFLMRHYVRPKFVRRDSKPASTTSNVTSSGTIEASEPKEVIIAPMPARLVEKGMPGTGLLVHILLSRFVDHLPFYRLEKIFLERYDVPISRQTMVDWIEQLCFWFAPIYQEMKKELLAGSYLQVDETVIRYLDREEPGRSHQGYFWVYSRPGGDVLFDWKTTRSHQAPLEFLKGFSGKIQTDGYGGYETLVNARAKELGKSDLLHFACWAHARRELIEAKDHDRRVLWVLRQIACLYEVEKRLRQAKAGPKLRQAVRAAQSKMVLSRLHKGLQCLAKRVLPGGSVGKAIAYALNRWEDLCRYAEHGEVEIDNNSCENAIRPTAIGKKNFLFIGHPEAGGRSAMVYSILGSCQRHGVNPAKYLQDILTRLPDLKQADIASLTPKAWAKAHPQTRVKPAR